VSDAHDYLATRKAMDIVGISEKEQVFHRSTSSYALSCLISCSDSFVFMQEAIFRVVAAILHLGNVDFAKGKEVDSSVLKDDKSKFHLKIVAELLMYAVYH